MTTGTLHGRTALVTGGSRGIGAAIVRSLAQAGAAVAVNYRERAGEANALVDAIGEAGGRAIAVAADVSQSDAVARMVHRVESELGSIGILINNAGVAITRDIQDISETDFDQTIAVNLKSVFLCTQAVLPMMRSKGWGRIINVSSGAARGAGSIGPHYNASKAGIEGLTRGYAARLVKEGITVNAVAPTFISTPGTDEALSDPAFRADVIERIAGLHRIGEPMDVAGAVVFLASPAASLITGHTILIDGGWTAR